MSYRLYGDLTDKGIQWTGPIPEHWHTERAKWLFEKVDRPVREQDETVTCFRDGMVTLRTNRRLDGFTESVKEIGYQGVRVGDLVIHEMDAFAGAIGVSDSDGKCTPVYTVCEPRDGVHVEYFSEVVREMARREWILALAKGIRERSTDFRYKAFAEQVLPLPPLPEQRAIARFLDRETAKIDALVEEQRKLIELLKEKRQALISQAVTKGLDPNAKMKDSGIEWLGEVPEHWVVSRLNWEGAELSYGFTNPMPTVDDGPFLLTANDIQDGWIDYENARHTSPEAYEDRLTEKSRPQARDVLITKDGTLGRAAVFDGSEACINQSIATVRLDESFLIAEFLVYCFQSDTYLDRILFEAGGTTIKHIYISRLGRMPIAFPDVEEQLNVVDHLGRVLQSFDTLVAQAGKAEELLLERRSALISAAVTGKIDVRDMIDEEVEA